MRSPDPNTGLIIIGMGLAVFVVACLVVLQIVVWAFRVNHRVQLLEKILTQTNQINVMIAHHLGVPIKDAFGKITKPAKTQGSQNTEAADPEKSPGNRSDPKTYGF